MIAVREAAVWHDVECGAYGADLAVWADLAQATGWRGAPAEVLELGCGTGRVALHLARRGHRVTGVDLDAPLVEVLAERAAVAGLPVEAMRADARELDLGRRFGLVAAPMQLVQLLDEAGRGRALEAVAAHLAPGGLAALAILDRPARPWRAEPGDPGPAPDVRELDGWVYSSLPLAVELDGDAIVLRRLRQTVSPAGALRDAEDVVRIHQLTAERLEREAAGARLQARERREVAATDEHLGSTIVVLEASA